MCTTVTTVLNNDFVLLTVNISPLYRQLFNGFAVYIGLDKVNRITLIIVRATKKFKLAIYKLNTLHE